MIQPDPDDTSGFEMSSITKRSRCRRFVQEEEEGESLSEQLEKLLAKYEDPDGPQDTEVHGGL